MEKGFIFTHYDTPYTISNLTFPVKPLFVCLDWNYVHVFHSVNWQSGTSCVYTCKTAKVKFLDISNEQT